MSRLLTTIAQASEGGATHFLTRDVEALRHTDTIERLTGLAIVTPEDFLVRLHTQGDERDFRTRTIAASGLSISSSPSIPTDSDLASLCPRIPDGRLSELERRLARTVSRDTGRLDEIVSDQGSRLALAASYRPDQCVVVTVLRSSATGDAYTVTRQLAHHLRVGAASQGQTQVRVEDVVEGTVAGALTDEGFRYHDGAWIAEVRTDIHGPGDPLPAELDAARLGPLTPERVSAYEKYMWPSKVFTGVVPCYVVPIQPDECAQWSSTYPDQAHRKALRRTSKSVDCAPGTNVYYMDTALDLIPARTSPVATERRSTNGRNRRALSWLDPDRALSFSHRRCCPGTYRARRGGTQPGMTL